MKKKKNLWIWICTLALVGCIGLIVLMEGREPKEAVLPRDEDREFAGGSSVSVEELTSLQTESLYKLCKVWGYAKYRHPQVVDGTLNWDAHLFRVMPKVLEAETPEETNEVLLSWLTQFPLEKPESDETVQSWLEGRKEDGYDTADFSWLTDEDFYGEALCGYLAELSEIYIADREDAYASFEPEGIFVSHEQERNPAFREEDDGVKLLALFRFWNIYEYYSPNRDITVKNWDEVLMEMIPKVAEGKSYRDYVLAMGELTALTGDAHISLSDKEGVLQWYYGTYVLPVSFVTVDGQAVVSACKDNSAGLKPGDILVEIDGTSVDERIGVLSRYFALSEPDKFASHLATALLGTQEKTAEVTVIRKGEEKRLTVPTSEERFLPEKRWTNGMLPGENIGYIDPSALAEGDLEKLMEEFADTDGIIVDLREYPSVRIAYLLGEYIIPEPAEFAVVSCANQAVPGAFCRLPAFRSGSGVRKEQGDEKTYPHYDGKVVLLMDETSVSQSEFTIMALRQAPNAVVVGSPSIGADGNVVRVNLPGGLALRYSGLGIYTPELGQTQRTGLTPDVECYPTVEGLREERDELVEKGVQLIQNSVSAG